MYLSNLKLWNFRKFGSESFDIENPDLDLDFNRTLNILVGENDSGKTAIIDAIKIVLKTHSYEWIRVTDDDFYNGSERFRIEFIFKGLEDEEAKYFTEWLSWEGEGEEAEPFLKIIYDVTRTSERILPADVRAGSDEVGKPISAEARYHLKTTYLKPLRDAESELIPKRYSRLSQILKEHEIFKDEENHYLLRTFKEFNDTIASYFGKENIEDDNQEEKEEEDKVKDKVKEKEKKNTPSEDNEGKIITDVINEFIKGFYDKDSKVTFKTAEANLKSILENLELSILDIHNPGLGTLNRLFMAAELLHLNKSNWNGLRLGIIEEIEAHLHPQVQMKVIETLKKQDDIQLILTTHSPNLASKINLKNLIICKDQNAFPMGSNYTELDSDNYRFLEKFLDVTKANLFFAKGLILVEGWSEEILVPSLAKKTGYDLTENEVSVINVGNLGFANYYKIFLRRNGPQLNIPISIISDVDVREHEKENDNIKKIDEAKYKEKCLAEKEKSENKIKKYSPKDDNGEITQEIIKPFISKEWTLEWCLFKSNALGEVFKKIVTDVHPQMDEDDFEKELAWKLLPGKKLAKTKIAYKYSRKFGSIKSQY